MARVQIPAEFLLPGDQNKEVSIQATTHQVDQSLADLSGHTLATRERHYIARDEHSVVSNAIAAAAIEDLVGHTAIFSDALVGQRPALNSEPSQQEALATSSSSAPQPMACEPPAVQVPALTASQLLG